MKHIKMFAYTILFALGIGGQSVEAAPCDNLRAGWLNGSYVVTHADHSTKKSMVGVTLQKLAPAQKRMLALREDEKMTVDEVYGVSNYQFANDANSAETVMVSRFDRVMTVSLPKNPNLCFMLWGSSIDSTLTDVNTIIESGASSVVLGSNNKADASQYMFFSRQH